MIDGMKLERGFLGANDGSWEDIALCDDVVDVAS